MNRPHWHAGWNMPGYLPETDPAAFTDHESAKRYLIAEMDRAGDHLFEAGQVDEADELSNVMQDLNLISEGEGFSTWPIANVVWWLQFSGESFTCDESCFEQLEGEE